MNQNSAGTGPYQYGVGAQRAGPAGAQPATTGAASRASSASSSATSATARRSCSRCSAATSTSRSTSARAARLAAGRRRHRASRGTTSLDYVYMALTSSAELNPALANKRARQAIAYAIDYDGIRRRAGRRLRRAARELPAGRRRRLDRRNDQEFGFRQDLDKRARSCSRGRAARRLRVRPRSTATPRSPARLPVHRAEDAVGPGAGRDQGRTSTR